MLERDPLLELVYVCDGTLEGYLTSVFVAYERKERPNHIACIDGLMPTLMQSVAHIETDIQKAARVRDMLIRQCGYRTYRSVLKAALSFDVNAGTYIFEYIDYLIERIKTSECRDCKFFRHCSKEKTSNKGRCFIFKGNTALNDLADNRVQAIFSIARSVDNECEKIRQFARFEHLRIDDADLWFARINPKHSVIPLIMDHFVERFNVQPFVMYDEVHGLAGVYEGSGWFMAALDDSMIADGLSRRSHEEEVMQDAWKRFYDSLSIDSRYNPELQRNFMPKRFWRNITEMKQMAGSSLSI